MYLKSFQKIVASAAVFISLSFYCHLAGAQNIDSSAYSMLKYRMIGPFRGGRTVGASGSAKQPNVFYIGVNNGGVWKTTDYGRTWMPVKAGRLSGAHRAAMIITV